MHFAVLIVALMVIGLSGTVSASIVWVRQFGTSTGDIAQGVASGGTGIYVVGYQSDGYDGFIRKYSLEGVLAWTDVIDSGGTEEASAAVSDSTGVYVAGYVSGTFPGQTNAGDCSSSASCTDAFVRKYSPDGTEEWTRQFGTPDVDEAYAVGADATGVYVAGETHGLLPDSGDAKLFDAFIRKYSSDGDILWTRQFGGPSFDRVYSIASDGLGVYAGGITGNPPPDPADCCDAFLRRFTTEGADVWVRQFGTSGLDFVTGVDVDSSGVYVAGVTDDPARGLNRWRGDHGVFVGKFSLDGDDLWMDRFGTPRRDWAGGVSVGPLGLYAVGITCHVLPGQGNNREGGCDSFVRRYAVDGVVDWTLQFGTLGADSAAAVVSAGTDVFVAGWTDGTFDGETNLGGQDAFLARLEG